MTEFITRLTDDEKWFIDGMTEQFCGLISPYAEQSDITTENLFHIINFCLTRFKDTKGLQFEMLQRWKIEGEYSDGIFQDFYDKFFEEHQDFFQGLVNRN
jgi:hypothetical protein